MKPQGRPRLIAPQVSEYPSGNADEQLADEVREALKYRLHRRRRLNRETATRPITRPC